MNEEVTIRGSSIPPKVIGRMLEFYLVGEIQDPSFYVEDFDAIRHAGEDDIVKYYINSHGGDLFTAIQFMRVNSETQAHVIASVEGLCMSAATLIMLTADEVEVTAHSSCMVHNYSGGAFGKGGEQFTQIQHEREWSTALLNAVYKDFLTPAEIQAVLDNKDIYMGHVELAARLESRRQKQGDEETLA